VGYDHQTLYLRVVNAVSVDPQQSLEALCGLLQIGRHTVARCLRDKGLTFRRLQSECQSRQLTEALSNSGTDLIKQIADRAGYSPSSFSRRVKALRGMTPTALRRAGSLAVAPDDSEGVASDPVLLQSTSLCSDRDSDVT
jgi:AraC-like DNA-binding protein